MAQLAFSILAIFLLYLMAKGFIKGLIKFVKSF